MKSKRIALIIEISFLKQSLLGRLLQNIGFSRVIVAVSRTDALHHVEITSFDAVFVEVAGDDDGGFGFIRGLRAGRGNNHRVPIIVVSSDRQRTTIQNARDAGAHGFLVKPFSSGSLEVQIARILDDRREYIDAPTFRGPDRRRAHDPAYAGPERRSSADTLFVG